MEKIKGMMNIDARDVDSGVVQRVWVPTKLLKRLPRKEPNRTNFLKKIHDAYLMAEGRIPN